MKAFVVALLLTYPAGVQALGDTINLTDGGSVSLGNTTVTCNAPRTPSFDYHCECRIIVREGWNCWDTLTWAAVRVSFINGQEHASQITSQTWETRACPYTGIGVHPAPDACESLAANACN